MAYGINLISDYGTKTISEDFPTLQVASMHIIGAGYSSISYTENYPPMVMFGYAGYAAKANVQVEPEYKVLRISASAPVKVLLLKKAADCPVVDGYGLRIYDASGTRIYDAAIGTLVLDSVYSYNVSWTSGQYYSLALPHESGARFVSPTWISLWYSYFLSDSGSDTEVWDCMYVCDITATTIGFSSLYASGWGDHSTKPTNRAFKVFSGKYYA